MGQTRFYLPCGLVTTRCFPRSFRAQDLGSHPPPPPPPPPNSQPVRAEVILSCKWSTGLDCISGFWMADPSALNRLTLSEGFTWKYKTEPPPPPPTHTHHYRLTVSAKQCKAVCQNHSVQCNISKVSVMGNQV